MTGVVVVTTNLGTASMVQIAAPPSGVNAAGAFVDRRAAPDAEDGMRATTVRTFGTVSLIALPSNVTPPSGWNGYLLSLTNYSDQASAAAGITTAAPTASVQPTSGASQPTILYWNGTGYSSIVGAALNSTGTIPLPATMQVGPQQFGTGGSRRWVCTTITPSLRRGGASTSSVGSPRTSVKASMAAPIQGTIGYRVSIYSTNPTSCALPTGTLLSTPVDLTVSIDLGTAQAVAKYTPAPTGV
jgi:hypothetical protein